MIVVNFVFVFFAFFPPIDSLYLKSQSQLIVEAGYPVETHTVDSAGYLLTVYRLPQPSRSVGSVMVVHGLFCSAIDWIMHGRGKALGYLLHDAGLDVWLPNLRGSTNSSQHKTLNSSHGEYWDFTFEELGTEDIFSLTDYILKLSGEKKIYYISNSMGGTSMLAGLSVKPEYNEKFHQLIMFGPHSNMKNSYGNVRRLSVMEPQIGLLRNLRRLKIHQVPPGNFEGFSDLLYGICKKQSYEKNLCMAAHNFFIGNGALIDFPLFIEFCKYYPTPISLKTIRHIFQTMGTGTFSKFDYGGSKNIQFYGTPIPEPYNLSKITAPVFLIYAKKDNLVPPKDILWLKSQLPNVVETQYITLDDFAHSSFLWHPNITEIAYKRIVSSILNFEIKNASHD